MVIRCDKRGCFEKADFGFYISAKAGPKEDFETMFEGDFCKIHFEELMEVSKKVTAT